MNKLKVMTVFGTRPEAIKMAPLVKELEKDPNVQSMVCVTAQHRQMLDQVLSAFNIVPDFDLNIMKDRQTLLGITTRGLEGLSEVFEREKPDIVLVHGDTTTTFVGSLAAFYNKIAVGHVEAGLRTYDKYSPFPEEMNRKLTGTIADIHFAPTNTNKKNLLKEGIKEEDIIVTGNTVIDAMQTTVRKDYVFENETLRNIDFTGKRVIAVTAHRRENIGEPLENIFNALLDIANKYEDILIVDPVHLNPAVKEVAERILGDNSRVRLIEPIGVLDMHNLMDRSYIVMTDSGGLQEEAPSLGKPVLVMRSETERPEAVEAGTVRLAGIDRATIFEMACKLLDSEEEYNKMAKAVNPYGDGLASSRIVKTLLKKYNITEEEVVQFGIK